MTLTETGSAAPGLVGRLWAYRFPVRPQPQPLGRADAAVVVALVALAAALYGLALLRWGDATIRLSIGGRWFQSDGWRVFDDLTRFGANHYRDQVHPLFSLVGLACTGAIRLVFRADPVEAIRIFNGLCFMIWCGLLYATVRLAGCRKIDALLAVAVAMASAGSLFWFIVPETYVPGTVSILVCLFLAAWGRARDGGVVAAAAGSLSFTMTNWIAGLAMIGSLRRFGRGAILAAMSLAVVVGGWGVGKVIFPQPATLFLLPSSMKGEQDFIGDREAGGLDNRAAGIFISPMVAASIADLEQQPTGPLLSVQKTAVNDLSLRHPLFLATAVLSDSPAASVTVCPGNEDF